MRAPRLTLEAQRTGLVQSAQETRPRPVREASPSDSILPGGAAVQAPSNSLLKQAFRTVFSSARGVAK